jgi:hypothetical protein
MADYGSVPGVSAYVRHMTLDTANNPKTAQVETWLVQRSAQLTSWLAEAGYTVPVVVAAAKAVLDRYANVGAACDAELAQRTGGYGQAGKPEQNRRESRFCQEFAAAEAWIMSGALLALGVPQTVRSEVAAVGALTTTAPVSPPAGVLADANDRGYRGDVYRRRLRRLP